MKSSILKQQYVATSIMEELEIIQDLNGGILAPSNVVEYAKNPETLLHKKFEWDDSKAAERYRLWQARQIISLELVVINKGAERPSDIFLSIDSAKQKSVRAFVSLTDDRHGDDTGYRSIHAIIEDDDLREKLLEDARKDMLIFRRKYYLLKELTAVFEAMSKV